MLSVQSLIVWTGLVPATDNGDHYLALNISLLRFFGFWPGTNRDLVIFGILGSVLLYDNLHFLSNDLYTNDMVESIEIGCTSFAAFNTTFKAVHFVYHREKIRKMVEDVLGVCADIGASFPEYKAVFDARERRIRRISFNLILFVGLLFLDWLIVPLLTYTPGEDAQLPLKLNLPFRVRSVPVIVATYAYTELMFLCLTVIYTLPLLLYLGITMMSCDQLKILSNLLIDVPEKNGVSSREKLNFCIHIHSRILSFGEKLKSFLSPLLLIQFLFAMAAISLSVFPITRGTMTHMQLGKNIGFIILHLIELYFACYFGAELVSYSDEVQEAAYNCNWYDLEEDLKKDLVMVIARAQRPFQLSIGKVQQVDLSTFTDVMKFCYTVFTLLQQLDAKKMEM